MESQQEQPPFFKLPTKVRSVIYEQLIPHMSLEERRVAGSKKIKRPGRLASYPPIMHTCKKIFRDARPIMCKEVHFTIEGTTMDIATIHGFGRLHPEYLRALSVVYHLNCERPGVPDALEWIGARAPLLSDLRLRFEGHPRTWHDLAYSGVNPMGCDICIARQEMKRFRYMIPLLWFIDSAEGLRTLHLSDIYPKKKFVAAVEEVLADRDEKVDIVALPSEYEIDE